MIRILMRSGSPTPINPPSYIAVKPRSALAFTSVECACANEAAHLPPESFPWRCRLQVFVQRCTHSACGEHPTRLVVAPLLRRGRAKAPDGGVITRRLSRSLRGGR